MKASALLTLALLAGCASTENDGYPSLAPRDVEKIDINAPAEDNSSPSPPADGALIARLNSIEARARAGNAKFEPLYSEAQRAASAARGSAPASEAWVVANMAISRAEAATADTAAAASEMDQLVADLTSRASQEPRVGGINEALAAQGRVSAIYQSQKSRLSVLNRQLNGG